MNESLCACSEEFANKNNYVSLWVCVLLLICMEFSRGRQLLILEQPFLLLQAEQLKHEELTTHPQLCRG